MISILFFRPRESKHSELELTINFSAANKQKLTFRRRFDFSHFVLIFPSSRSSFTTWNRKWWVGWVLQSDLSIQSIISCEVRSWFIDGACLFICLSSTKECSENRDVYTAGNCCFTLPARLALFSHLKVCANVANMLTWRAVLFVFHFSRHEKPTDEQILNHCKIKSRKIKTPNVCVCWRKGGQKIHPLTICRVDSLTS